MVPSTAGDGRAILEGTASDAELVGDHVVAARALVNLAWEARQSSRVDEAREMVQRMRLHAEAAGFDSLASHSRVEAIAVLAVVDGELEEAIEVLDRGAVEVPPRAEARHRRRMAWVRAGLARAGGGRGAGA